jgi:hypothetical protein
MQPLRAKPVTPHETQHSPRAKLVSRLARFISHLARTFRSPLRGISALVQANSKVGRLFRRFVC